MPDFYFLIFDGLVDNDYHNATVIGEFIDYHNLDEVIRDILSDAQFMIKILYDAGYETTKDGEIEDKSYVKFAVNNIKDFKKFMEASKYGNDSFNIIDKNGSTHKLKDIHFTRKAYRSSIYEPEPKVTPTGS